MARVRGSPSCRNHRWTLTWVPWEDWTERDGVLVVRYSQSGTSDGPQAPVVRVEIVEADRWVIVIPSSRNGHGGGRLARLDRALGVELAQPLGTRKVHDGGGTGERRPRYVSDERTDGAAAMLARAAAAPRPDPVRFPR